MAGGKGPSNTKPSSSSSHRKTRWESDQQKSKENPKHPPKENPNHPPKENLNLLPLPIPSPRNPNLNPSQSEPPFQPPLDLAAPPPPAYGFHMLDRRTIVLSDGSVRSYFALPQDYQDFPPQRRHENPEHQFPLKRKFGDENMERERERDEFARQRQQLLQYGNAGSGSSPYGLGRGEEMRANKQMRSEGGGFGGGVSRGDVREVDKVALKKAFLHFAKVVNEDASLRKKYLADGKQGSLQCVICARSSKDFPDMHGLVMHSYNSDSAESRVDHLGLHKVLCVLMGWNYSMPPDNSKAYQSLSASEAAANQDDLIMWPPLVIIHNTSTGKLRDGRVEGLGNKAMDSKIKDLGFSGKSKSLYGREGHQGITLMKYGGDQSGLKEAVRLAEFFEKENHGRRDWSLMQSLTSSGKDDENNPNLVKVDPKTGDKERIFYGYLATVSDLDKMDPETRKKAVIESMGEMYSQ